MTNSRESGRGYLIVIPWGLHHIGGVNQVVRDLSDLLIESANFRPVLLNTEFGSEKLTRMGIDHRPVEYRLTVNSPLYHKKHIRNAIAYVVKLPATVRQLALLGRNEDVSVINIHYPSLSALTFILTAGTLSRKPKLILSFHGADITPIENANDIEKRLWKFVISKADRIVTCSDALATRFSRILLYPKNLISVVHNGVNQNRLRKLAKTGRPPRELQEKKFILSAGTLEWKKGQDILISAFSRLAPLFPNHFLVIMGRKGGVEKQLRRQINELGLNDRVLVYTDVAHQDVLATMQKAELFVLPSRIEPFGIVLLEAATFRVPIIATNTGGIPEIIGTNEEFGILVPPDNEDELYSAMLDCLKNNNEALIRADRLCSHVESEFSLAKVHQKYTEIANG